MSQWEKQSWLEPPKLLDSQRWWGCCVAHISGSPDHLGPPTMYVVAQVFPALCMNQCQKCKMALHGYNHHFYDFLHHNKKFSRNRCFSLLNVEGYPFSKNLFVSLICLFKYCQNMYLNMCLSRNYL